MEVYNFFLGKDLGI